MNRSKLEVEADVHISKQSKSVIYSILDHEFLENNRIPLNPNFLTFKDHLLEYRYRLALMCHRGNTIEKTKEYKNNLLVFYIFLTSYIIITIATYLLLYNQGYQDWDILTIRISILGFILICSYSILFLIHNYPRYLISSKELFLILALLIVFYLEFCDEKVLSSLCNKDYEKNSQNHTLILACFLVMVKLVIFDSFFLITVLVTIILVMSIGLQLSLSSLSPFAILSEYLVLFVFLILQTIDSRQIDYRARQLF